MTDIYSYNPFDFSDAYVEPNVYTGQNISNFDYPRENITTNYSNMSNLQYRNSQLFNLTKKGMLGFLIFIIVIILNAVVMGLILSLTSSAKEDSFTKSYSFYDAMILFLRPFSNEYMNEFSKSAITKIIFILHMILMGIIILGLTIYIIQNFFLK